MGTRVLLSQTSMTLCNPWLANSRAGSNIRTLKPDLATASKILSATVPPCSECWIKLRSLHPPIQPSCFTERQARERN